MGSIATLQYVLATVVIGLAFLWCKMQEQDQ
jgi:hypothetical protein